MSKKKIKKNKKSVQLILEQNHGKQLVVWNGEFQNV